MSQITNFGTRGACSIITVTGDVGGAVSPDGVGNLNVLGGSNITTTGTLNTITIDLDSTITLTGVNATTFDTNVAAAGVTLSGTTLSADGTDANIDINITAKGTGKVILDDLQVATLTRGVVQSSSTGVITSSEGTDGQMLISSSSGAPTWAAVTSSANVLDVTLGSNSVSIDTYEVLQSDTGFASWKAAGPFYDDTVLGDFTLLVGGDGFIKGVPVSWVGPQTISGLASGNTYYIYIDDTGTIGKSSTRTDAMFRDYIVLFECWRDASLPTNIQFTVKENHPYTFPVESSNFLHNTAGPVIESYNNGANITLNGTQKIEISGADELDDHGLETIIPDSGGVAETFAHVYTNASGKWVVDKSTDTFPGEYNNAGVVTALGTNKYGVYKLYVSKDDLNSSTPTYIAVINDAQYNNLASAETAVSNGEISAATGELAALELARLGYIIFSESSTSIVEVIIDKNTLRSSSTTGGTNTAALVITDVTNFDGMLSSADTNVQAALETIDDWGKAPALPTTTGTDGQITINSNSFMHSYGTDNVFLGDLAGNFTLTATDCIGIGPSSLSSLTDGSHNISIGHDSGVALTTGDNNILLGESAMSFATDVNNAIVIGYNCYTTGNATDGDVDSIFIGNNIASIDAGSNNRISDNVIIGHDALTKLEDNLEANVIIGNEALSIAVGGPDVNVIIGHAALAQAVGGGVNGIRSNVAIGYHSMYGCTGTPQYNIALGESTGSSWTGSESSNIIFSNVGVSGENNTIRIGTQGTGQKQQNRAFIAGVYNTSVGATADAMIIDSAGQIGGLTGASGQVLQGGTKPSFSTATYPSTTSIGDILVSSAANTISATTGATTSGHVLMANGTGTAPTFQARLNTIALNAQTGTTYTFVIGDAGKMVTLTNGSAIALTVPPNSSVAFEVGTQIIIYQGGAGTVTVGPGSGVTVNSAGSLLDLNGQYAQATLTKIGTDVWVASGNLA